MFAPPDGARGEDPLAEAAGADGVTVHKFKRYRELLKNGGGPVPEVMAAVEAANADLHVLAFVTLFVPTEMCDLPEHGTIVYHPSLLPLHRGASAINWTIIAGDKEAGFTIFYADEGLDTGDIVLQRSVEIKATDTISSLYRDWLFPEGVSGIADAVKAIEDGSATRTVQEHRDNTDPPYYDPLCQEPMLIDFTKHVDQVHNLIRGCDTAPGAYFECLGVPITLYGSSVILGTGGFQQRAEALGTIPVDGNVGSSAIVLENMVVVNCHTGGRVLSSAPTARWATASAYRRASSCWRSWPMRSKRWTTRRIPTRSSELEVGHTSRLC